MGQQFCLIMYKHGFSVYSVYTDGILWLFLFTETFYVEIVVFLEVKNTLFTVATLVAILTIIIHDSYTRMKQ